MKPIVSFFAGGAFGLLAAAALLGRYQVVITSTGDGAGYVARLDRWTGEVSGQAVMRLMHTWETWSSKPNPYLE